MQFENSFDVPLPPEEAWKVLLDVPRIAPCLPGAELTEVVGDKFKGRAGVKIGPVNLYFAGEAEFASKDEAARKATIKGRGNDTKGRGQASATVNFALSEAPGGTRVNVNTDLNLTGAVAQYGRATGLMKEIAGAILAQFADNLRKEIEQSPSAAAGAAPAQPSEPATAPLEQRAAAEPSATGGQAPSVARPAASPAPMRPAQPAAATPISATKILGIALKSWVGGKFQQISSSGRSVTDQPLDDVLTQVKGELAVRSAGDRWLGEVEYWARQSKKLEAAGFKVEMSPSDRSLSVTRSAADGKVLKLGQYSASGDQVLFKSASNGDGSTAGAEFGTASLNSQDAIAIHLAKLVVASGAVQ